MGCAVIKRGGNGEGSMVCCYPSIYRIGPVKPVCLLKGKQPLQTAAGRQTHMFPGSVMFKRMARDAPKTKKAPVSILANRRLPG